MRLAHSCKAVATILLQVMGAAQVLQRAWRAYLIESKIRCRNPARGPQVQAKDFDTKRKRQTKSDDVDIWLS